MVSHPSNIGYIMPTPATRFSQFFGKYGFVSRWSIGSQAALSSRARWLPMPGICLCITALITVQTVCRCHFLSIIKAITDLRPETTASAPHFGTMSSGRCCDDDAGAAASILVIQMEISSLLVLDANDRAIGDFLVGLPVQRHPDHIRQESS